MKKLMIAAAITATLLTSGISMNLLADSEDAATAAAQQDAKISMQQAISIAEQAVGGRSSEAEFELENGVAIYEVDIARADGAEVEVSIDAQSGSIISQEIEDERDDHDADDDHATDDDSDEDKKDGDSH